MTVVIPTSKVTMPGNGSATVFSFSPIVIQKAADLEVTHIVIATGAKTILTKGTGSSNYAVSVSSFPGIGSIIYPADEVTPMPETEKLITKRLLVLDQQTNLENQGGYFADTQEHALDKLIMIAIQQQEVLDRSVALPIDVIGVSGELPAPSADKLLGWNSGATALENKSFASSGTLPDPVTTDRGGTGAITIANARTNLAAQEDVVTTRGDVIVGDSGGDASRLALGTSGQVLQSDGTDLVFATPGAPTGIPTGVVLPYLSTTAPSGWVLAAGKTVGNASSGGTERANADTEALFSMLWDNFADSEAPVSSGRGGSAAADFAADKNIVVSDLRGRTVFGKDDLGGTDAARLTSAESGIDGDTLGKNGGVETHALASGELAAHSHGNGSLSAASNGSHVHSLVVSGGSDGATVLQQQSEQNQTTSSSKINSAGAHTHTISGSTASIGDGTAHQNTPPGIVLGYIIKL